MRLKAGASHFIVVGGVSPYHVSGLASDLTREITASISDKPVKGVYELTIDRPPGASKTSGKVTIYVVDSAVTPAVAEVPVTLAAAEQETPKPAPAPTKPSITDASYANGKITVKFSLPSNSQNDTVKATAKNIDGQGQTLTETAAKGALQAEISGCSAGASYKISLDLTPPSGATTTLAYTKTNVLCGPAAAVPAPAIKTVPDPPTKVVATAETGAKITVSFAAPAKNGGSAITSYTATALLSAGGQALKPATSDTVSAITLTGCNAGKQYVVTVAAKNDEGLGQPGKSDPVTCKK